MNMVIYTSYNHIVSVIVFVMNVAVFGNLSLISIEAYDFISSFPLWF